MSNEDKLKLIVSTSPHIRSEESIPKVMWIVFITLLPAAAAGVLIFGADAARVIIISVATAVITEALIQSFQGKKITVYDGSAALTGLLFAFVISPMNPWYVVVIGSFFAIAIVKHAFGGLGQNIWNPALAARAFVLMAWATKMTAEWKMPVMDRIGRQPERIEGLTGATPLAAIKNSLRMVNNGELPTGAVKETAQKTFEYIQVENATDYLDLFVGTVGGSLGETCAFLLILGGLILLIKGYISWHIPFTFIGTVALLSWALPVQVPYQGGTELVWFSGDPIFHVFAGGLILGAFFMATDMVTSPMSKKGKIVFGVGCGVITVIIRLYGGYPEGVCYSILLMNTATPLIDRFTKQKIFGAPKKEKEKEKEK